MSNNQTREYFEKRAAVELKHLGVDERELDRQIRKLFTEMQEDISKQVMKFYMDYAIDNKLTLGQAKKILTNIELRGFKHDIKTYVDKIDKGDKLLLQELNALSTRGRISRLEKLQAEIDVYINKTYSRALNASDKLFSRTLKEKYRINMFNTYKMNGFGYKLVGISDSIIKSILNYPYDGFMFSEKIWLDRDYLSKLLKQEITSGITKGINTKDIAKNMKKKIDQRFSNIKRVVRTEHTFIMNEADKISYKETGVKEYQYLAALDTRTSDICKELDNKVFKLSEMTVGVNAPPMHPNCRSTTIPWFDDIEEDETRIAKDRLGRRIEVPYNMSYKEFEKEFL